MTIVCPQWVASLSRQKKRAGRNVLQTCPDLVPAVGNAPLTWISLILYKRQNIIWSGEDVRSIVVKNSVIKRQMIAVAVFISAGRIRSCSTELPMRMALTPRKALMTAAHLASGETHHLPDNSCNHAKFRSRHFFRNTNYHSLIMHPAVPTWYPATYSCSEFIQINQL